MLQSQKDSLEIVNVLQNHNENDKKAKMKEVIRG